MIGRWGGVAAVAGGVGRKDRREQDMSAAVSFYGSRYQQEKPVEAAAVEIVAPSRIRQRIGHATIRQILQAGTPKHQSPIQVSRVRKMASAFDPTKLDVFKVSIDESGRWWLEDGQHRGEAARLAEQLDLTVPVLFTEGMTQAELASYFIGINDRKQKPVGALIQAKAEAGDPIAVTMFDIAESHGFAVKMLHNGTAYGRDVITCADKLYKIVEEFGPDHTDRVLAVLRKAWDGCKDSTQNDILLGVSQFLIAYPEVSTDALANKLAKYMPKIVLGEIAAARARENLSTQDKRGYAAGRGVLELWNRHRKSERLNDVFNDLFEAKRKVRAGSAK